MIQTGIATYAMLFRNNEEIGRKSVVQHNLVVKFHVFNVSRKLACAVSNACIVDTSCRNAMDLSIEQLSANTFDKARLS